MKSENTLTACQTQREGCDFGRGRASAGCTTAPELYTPISVVTPHFYCLPVLVPSGCRTGTVSGFSCARRPCPLSQAPPARPRKPSAMFFQTPSLRAPSRFFRHHGPIAPRTRMSEQRSAPPQRLEPAVDGLTTHEAHVVTLRAPSEDVELREPMAYEWHQRDGTIVLEGLLTSRPHGGAHVYRCRRQVPGVLLQSSVGSLQLAVNGKKMITATQSKGRVFRHRSRVR